MQGGTRCSRSICFRRFCFVDWHECGKRLVTFTRTHNVTLQQAMMALPETAQA